ncbi:MAG: hypothetical protein IPM51_13005 [Sphingobacteriaceae bacterium]|nr:hypothetical protein [Sphingobacteriaceae bacterium]
MQNKFFNTPTLIIGILLMLLLLSSCAIHRKFQLAGINIWHQNKFTSKEEFIKKQVPFESEQHTTIELAKYVKIENSENLKVIRHMQISLPKTGEHKKSNRSFQKIEETRVKKNAPAKKYKLSITQVNGLAFVSFLLIPLMILGFFIPGSVGIAIAMSALIIGVALAAFTLAIGYDRRGVWMAGIAAGFWLVILVYLALVLFIF